MKNNLLNTFIYGAGAGFGVFAILYDWLSDQDVENFAWILSLVLVILVLFVVTEVLQRKTPETLASKPKIWDRILLFILLVVSGPGLISVRTLIDWTYVHPIRPGDFRGLGFIILWPIALLYGIVLLVVLLRIYAHRADTSFLIPHAANRRLYMFLLATLVGVLTFTAVYGLEQLTRWFLITPGLIGLLVYEILYRSRQWLGLKTLPVYAALAIPVAGWGNKFLYFLTHDLYQAILHVNQFVRNLEPMKLLLEPITSLFSAEYFPYNLYPAIKAVLFTLLAYWIIQTREA